MAQKSKFVVPREAWYVPRFGDRNPVRATVTAETECYITIRYADINNLKPS